MPEISIVIPLYNKGPHIAKTLNSVFNQTFQDFEIIIVDDGSTDNGVEVVRGFSDPRIKLFQQKNQGPSAARNRGVEETSANMVAFLDADDEWTPAHLETILRLRKKYPDAGLYATSYQIYISETDIRTPDYRHIPDSPWEGLLPDYFKSGALGDAPANSSVTGIPKRIFLEAGGFPVGYWYGEEHCLLGKIALKYPVAFSRSVGMIYHTDASNRSGNRLPPTDHEEPFIKIAREAMREGKVPQEYVESLTEYINRKELTRAEINLMTGNSKVAREILRRCRTKWYRKRKLRCTLLALLPFPLLQYIRQKKKGSSAAS
ncbi:MAG TPA: glycosyltransferase [Methanocella sp.]|nr:glycosyltransferase [Methanocella sp.]